MHSKRKGNLNSDWSATDEHRNRRTYRYCKGKLGVHVSSQETAMKHKGLYKAKLTGSPRGRMHGEGNRTRAEILEIVWVN